MGGNGWATRVTIPPGGPGGASANHTTEFATPAADDTFDIPTLIVRRGSAATFSVDVSPPAGQEGLFEHNAVVLADVGSRSNTQHFRPHVGSASGPAEPGSCVTVSHSANKLELSVLIPDDIPIGEYTMNVLFAGRDDLRGLREPVRVLVLFNAWCSTADEHVPTLDERNEYVLLEDGIYHYGQHNRIGKAGWNYGQFEPAVVAAALKILRPLRPGERADPTRLARAITRQINHQGRGGVLTGNWSGDYVGEGPRPTDPSAVWTSKDGRDHPASAQPPTHWNGSVEILRQWVQSGGKPVCYGQCWVFAGITTTLLRCLGLAARQLSNFRSAHDTHGNRMIEEYHLRNQLQLSVQLIGSLD
eukprot:COSAG01_NODE_104_length_26171_cov_96.617612_8_plen_360_part_00